MIDTPVWDQCSITVEQHIHKKDRKALRFALRKVRKVTGVRFRRVHTEGQIRITYDTNVPDNYYAYANWWAEGNSIFLSTIRIDPFSTKKMTKKDRRHLIMHELGHSFGLDHVFKNKKHIMYAWHNDKTTWSKKDKKMLRRATNCK